MKRASTQLLPVPVDRGLKRLIKQAAAVTHLSQADVMRSSLRIGVPELLSRFAAPPPAGYFADDYRKASAERIRFEAAMAKTPQKPER